MDLEQVKIHIGGIANLGPCSKETLVGIVDTIKENLTKVQLIDDIADVYMNVDKVCETLFEHLDDIDLYMNIIFDIDEVAEYLGSMVMERKECTFKCIQNVAELVAALTILNLGMTAINVSIALWKCI
jgi:hypothetical protein